MFIGLALREDGGVRLAPEAEIREWLNAHEWVSCDTETDGLGWDARVRMVQFGDTETGYAVSVTEPEGAAFVVDALMKFRGRLIFHNAMFDIRRLEQVGIDPDYIWPRAENTEVMARVWSPTEVNYQLKALSQRWDIDPDARDSQVALKEAMRKHNLKSRKATYKWDWGSVPRLVLARYAITDTILTSKLYVFLERELSTKLWNVVDKEYEAAQAVAIVTYHGMRLDREYALRLQAEWERWLAEETEWFKEVLRPHAWVTDKKSGERIPCEPNPQSLDHQKRYLLSEGWVPTKFTAKTGEPQLNKAVMKDLLLDANPAVREFVTRLREFKRIAKWKAAYVDNCLEEASRDGYVHAMYRSIGAKTGRMSCSNPPLQQLPKGGGGEVRRLFIASEGNVISSVDYSQIEMRLAGHFANDPYLIEAYKQGRDVYQEMADFIGCTRPQGKIASLAALYGSKGKSIALALGTSVEEAVRIVTKFWEWLPTLSNWSVSVTNQAKGGGAVTSRWGRRLKPHAPYAAGNSIIQGTAAEVMKEGILRLADARILPYVVAIVHDEVVMDLPKSEAQDITDQAAFILEDRSFTIPLTTEASVYGDSWGDGYSDT